MRESVCVLSIWWDSFTVGTLAFKHQFIFGSMWHKRYLYTSLV